MNRDLPVAAVAMPAYSPSWYLRDSTDWEASVRSALLAKMKPATSLLPFQIPTVNEAFAERRAGRGSAA